MKITNRICERVTGGEIREISEAECVDDDQSLEKIYTLSMKS